MRKIDKGAPIESFSKFVRTHPHARWEDAKDMRPVWRKYMLNCEQHGMSGYTEEPLKQENSHIDHFRKQSLFNTLVFDWNNFIVDGVDETYGAKFKDKCVTSREDNDRLLINPVIEDVRRFFKYELNGNISVASGLSPSDAARADYTIRAFNLNEASLSERRKRIINIVMDYYSNLSDESVLEVLEPIGFKSVVEQLLDERKKEEDSR